MIDSDSPTTVRVSKDGTAGPYIMVPMHQLSRVRETLDSHQISYWVDREAISLDGKPAIAFVNLGRLEDARRIQALFDDTR